MKLDVSFEYDAAYEEYRYDNVRFISENSDIWISYHTPAGKDFLEAYNWFGDYHKRFKVNHELGTKILNDLKNFKLDFSYFGFYWKDQEHTISNFN